MEGFLNPNDVLKQLNLKENMVAADFGSGSGGWVMPLAKILEEGKVYAIDILEEPLSALKSRANLEKMFNVEVIKSDVERENGSKLMASTCDLVLMTNLLFECEDKKTVLGEGKRVLKEGGKILVVDWKIDAPKGPAEGRISAEDVKKITKEIGLKLEKDF
jgi:ubiquinone/menaquinone biosynthesis C-methylase UbiE